MDEDKSLRDASTPDAIRLAPSPKRADVSPFRRFAIAVVGAGSTAGMGDRDPDPGALGGVHVVAVDDRAED